MKMAGTIGTMAMKATIGVAACAAGLALAGVALDWPVSASNIRNGFIQVTGPMLQGGQSVEQQIANARGGETIRLPADYRGPLTINRRVFERPIRIEAGAAVLTGISIISSAGVEVRGGSIASDPALGTYGITIRQSRDVAISGMTITAVHRGIVIDRSTRIMIANNRLTGLRSDGVNIALSSFVTVRGNVCTNFSPRPAVYDARGNIVTDGDHPDCIQAWSRPTAPPTNNIIVENNVMNGRMQGIFFGNHTRDGVDDGGFDNVIIRNNQVTVSYGNAVRVSGLRGGEVSGNRIATVAGAVLPNRPNIRVRANLTIDGVGVRACGNSVADVPNAPGQQPC